MSEGLSKVNHNTIPISRLVVLTKPQNRKFKLKTIRTNVLSSKKNFGPGCCLGKVSHPVLPVVFLRLDPRTYSHSGPLTCSSLESQSSSTPESVLSSIALLHWVLSYTTIPFSRKWRPDILPLSCSSASLAPIPISSKIN